MAASSSPPLSPSSVQGPILRSLPLPNPDSTTSAGSGRTTRSGAGGWDATVANDAGFNFDAASALSADARRSCSVSPHAISHGCSVVGIRRTEDSNSDNSADDQEDGGFGNDQDWVAWEATFDHRVCRVTSNADGSVVVASTAGGTVSLLRGSDGKVLATRRVYAVGDEDEDDVSSMLPAEIAFVSGGENYTNAGGDILAILVPPREETSSASESECDEFGNPVGPTASTNGSSEVPYINIILVSGIDGARLNSSDPAEMAAAAGKMSIDALELTIPPPSPSSSVVSDDEDENCCIMADEVGEDNSHVVSLGGCYVGDRTVRFLALDGAGGLSAHDYDTKTRKATLVNQPSSLDAPLLKDGEGRWKVDESVGICVDGTHGLFLLSAIQNSSAKICYFAASNLALKAEYILETNQPRLYAMAPIPSCESDVAAAAIAFKSTASDANGCIVVVQTVMNCAGDPCVVFKVPIVPQLDQEIRWIDVALADMGNCISNADSKDARHYSFHYKVSYNSGIGECMTFCGDAGDVVGRFRRFLAKGNYDEADALLASSGASSATKGEYGTIHGSEVALQRFKHIIDGGNVTSAENMTEAKGCLRRLSSGAVTGGDRGVKCLLSASNALLSWPSAMLSADASAKILARDYRIAVSAMAATVSDAMKATPPAHLPALRAEKSRLDSKVLAIRCVEHVASGADDEGSVVVSPMLAYAASPADVFRSMILEGSWVAAEMVRRSEFSQSITPEHMASAIVGLPATVDPHSYCSWLEKSIIPGLTINHPLLAAIRYWACRLADAFDDDGENGGLGLDSAITLLKTVADATANLSTSMHTSFISSGPTADTNQSVNDSRTLNDTSSSLNTSTSYNQDENQSTKALFGKPPPPSVMQLGVLRGGAPRQRGTASFMARRVQRGTGTNKGPTSAPSSSIDDHCFNIYSACDTHAVKLYRQFEDKDIEAEAVEVKLGHAISLRNARDAGLPQRIVTLRLYGERGGSSFIAKELVRIISSKASDDADREAQIMDRVKPFCEAAKTDFNVVLSMYTKDLCDSNRNNARVLLEAASLARLCTGSARCEVALKVLRAAVLCTEQPPALSNLSREAIEWAIDDEVRSELEEATRLLVVDRIVRRYCGNGAQELFRVADPHHGLRLLHFVCRHIDGSSTIQDALALCDAFTHLSKADACVLILRRMALSASPESNADDTAFRADQCASLLRYLYTKDPILAEEVGVETCMYLSEAVQDCSPMMGEASSTTKQLKQKEGKAAARAAIGILSVIQENASKLGRVHKADAPKTMLSLGTSSWSELLQKFQSIYELQSTFSVYLSLSDLESETIQEEVCRLLLRPAVELLEGKEANADSSALEESLSCARRGIGLLFTGNYQDASILWCKAVGNQATNLAMNSSDDSASIAFLVASGLLDELSTDAAFATIYSVATAHCIRASKEASSQTADPLHRADDFSSEPKDEKESHESILLAMRCIIRASSVLEDHALRFCSRRLLGPLVSLTGLADTIGQVLTRGDGGSGESMETFRVELDQEFSKRREIVPCLGQSEAFGAAEGSRKGREVLPITPPLHSDWYVGDGLLLPPVESLQLCMVYCKEFMTLIRSTNGSTMEDDSIYDFLNDRGAHTIALRLRASASAIELVANNDISPFDVDNSILGDDGSISNESKYLVERSLGGSGSGITSGSIDSELALAYLLTLPIKTAFKVYRACLPSAISKRDFARVATLATIGVRAGDGSSQVLKDSAIREVVAWKKQDIFVDQCRRLSSNARWWGVLQTFGVTFDPRRFDGKEKAEVDSYVASLVLPLIAGASKTLLIASAALDQVLSLATRFVSSYGLDDKLAAQKHVEFLLSLPEGYADKSDTTQRPSSSSGFYDVRGDLRVCERAAKDTLLLLPSPMARASILRRCLISLEMEEKCFRDYERYSFVVSLYLNELALVLSDKSNKSDFAAFQREYECIDRRQDSLLILLSYFQDRPMQERPPFPKLFTPLPTPFKSDQDKPAVTYCGVLGHESASSSPDDFDPIQPLLPILSADGGASSVAALSPLCFSLGLPAGYIHARSLHLRIKKAMSIGTSLPPFDSSVRPIINRVKGSRDAAELAEWCALKYPDGSKDRLECLELALSHAMRASSEAEQKARAHKGVGSYAKSERLALDAVKRIGEMKSALADRIKVESILSEGYSPAMGVSSHVRSILSGLVDQVQENHAGSDLISPEEFVERLLREASSMTSEAVVTNSTYFTMDDFRQVAVSVHKAISSLADGHSHVDVGDIARKMARRWLVHADAATASSKEDEPTAKKVDSSSTDVSDDKKSAPSTPSRNTISAESDDTEDFVMNLNDLGADGDVWSDDVGSANATSSSKSSSSSGNGVIVADEEPSALTGDGCAREEMERSNIRVSLRIAFVMSYAVGYHKRESSEDGEESSSQSASNRARATRRTPLTSSKLNRTFSSKTSKSVTSCNSSNKGDTVLDHARELLGIAFAKKSSGDGGASGMPLLSEMSPSQRNSSTSMSMEESAVAKEMVSQDGKVHSFAMRYRALRVASILCPQEALDLVIRSEGYGGEQSVDLEKCAFASFLAMEAEAMGLAIPSSDLVHLSTMSFSSYARALWRNHGHNAKGRLLLLLVELCLRDTSNTRQNGVDGSFLVSLISELSQKQLPRSLLSSLELVASNRCAATSIGALGGGEETLHEAVQRTAMLIMRDLKGGQKAIAGNAESSGDRSDESINTIQRLCSVVNTLCPQDSSRLVQMMCVYAASSEEERIKEAMIKLAAEAASSLEDGETRSNAFLEVIRCGGKHYIERKNNTPAATDGTGSAATTLLVHEESYQRDFNAAMAAVET